MNSSGITSLNTITHPIDRSPYQRPTMIQYPQYKTIPSPPFPRTCPLPLPWPSTSNVNINIGNLGLKTQRESTVVGVTKCR